MSTLTDIAYEAPSADDMQKAADIVLPTGLVAQRVQVMLEEQWALRLALIDEQQKVANLQAELAAVRADSEATLDTLAEMVARELNATIIE